jgi:ATP-binding cassette, subfamily B, bacterial
VIELLSGCRQLLAIAWRRHRSKTLVAVVLMLGGAAAAPAIALALRMLTDAAVAGDATAAALYGVAVAVLAIAALTFSHFAHIAYFELSELSVLDLEQELMGLANGSAGMAHHEQPEFADKLIVVRQNIQWFRNAFQALLSIAGLALAVLLTVVLLVRLHPLLLLLIPLAVPPLVAGRRAEQRVDRAKVATAEQTRVALGLFRLTASSAPGKELRIFRLQHELLRRHRTLWTDVTRRLWRAQLLGAALRAGGHLVFAAGYLAAILLVVREAVAGRRTVGDVVLSITLAAQVNQLVANAATLLQDLHRMGATLRHLSEIRAVAGGGDVPGDQPAPERLTHGIDLVDVSFTYPDTEAPVLREVNLKLQAGTTVAIVGENGAGKSSLVKLLCGFYPPTAGQILVDGVAMGSLRHGDWRRRITAGFQDFVRFELPARQAVGVGDLPHVDSDEAVLGALDRARARSLLLHLEQGLDTPLGTSYAEGVDLSGGQWQKLALGRAFMREQPLLLVLDEPTAALDAESEHALFERYTEQARRTAQQTGAITLLVSHRFSTVRMADLIVVLADGRVAEVGDHAALIRDGGLYAELYQIQARAYS